MTIPPEAAFDRYLRSQNEKGRKKYPGKYDLDQLDSGSLKELLLGLQVVLNLSLASEQPVPEHRDHPPFHVDYIKSTEANAIAFRHDGYSFIGVTILLIEVAAQLCARLCNSLDLLHALGLEPTQEVSEVLGSVLLEILLFFVVSHEYTHIVHGHPLSEVTESGLIHEFSIGGRTGDFDDQILEADADSYAIYHVMQNWISGSKRPSSIALLHMDSASLDDQDGMLFACIVAAIGSYFILHPVPQLNAESVYRLRHPPHPVRLNSLMETAIAWCRQNRAHLEDRMKPEQFDSLLSLVAGLVWDNDELRAQNWRTQVAFLKTAEGASYVAELRRRKDEYRASL